MYILLLNNAKLERKTNIPWKSMQKYVGMCRQNWTNTKVIIDAIHYEARADITFLTNSGIHCFAIKFQHIWLKCILHSFKFLYLGKNFGMVFFLDGKRENIYISLPAIYPAKLRKIWWSHKENIDLKFSSIHCAGCNKESTSSFIIFFC